MTLAFEIGYMHEGTLACDSERGVTIVSALAKWLERTATPSTHVVYIRVAERNTPK